MARYIQRHSKMKRWIHGIHMVATVVLLFTGAVVFVPAIGRAFGPQVVDVLRIFHRVFAVTFIGVPIIGAIVAPSGAKHLWKNTFEKWDDDDREFMKKFVPYMLAPKKVHMPKQHEVKSGQRLADGGLVLFAILIALSGAVLWAGAYVSVGVFAVAKLVHDISFLMIAILGIAHLYLGAGIFQPYRGMGRVMFGDGLISEADARYHWGHWAEEELKSGEKVVEA
jgi:formate dehydrogenase subunit gamma